MDKRTFIKLLGLGTTFGITQLVIGRSPLKRIWIGEDEKTFLKACREGNTKVVREMLANDKELLQAKDQLGRSGFALALLAHHREIGDLLKGRGYETDVHEAALDLDWDRFVELLGEGSQEAVVRVNSDHPVGGSTMWAAAKGGAGSNIWRVYAQSGNPDLNTRGKAGSTPLQQALLYPDLEVGEMTAASLLSNDASPNASLNAEQPPLHIAAERGSLELVEMLIRLGAEVDQVDQKGRTARQLAERNGHEALYSLLVNHQEIPRTCRTSRYAYNLEGKPYQRPNMDSVPQYLQGSLVGQSHGNLEAVTKRVEADPRLAHSVATTSEGGVEAGSHMGRKDVVEFLLEHGAPYSLPTAVMLGDMETVKRYLDEDPQRIHERGAHDFALLWYPVIGRCDLDMTQLLLDRGAKVEEQHFLGTTALHWACMGGPIELVELLIENGADVNRVGRKFGGKRVTPIQMTEDEKLIGFLKGKGAK